MVEPLRLLLDADDTRWQTSVFFKAAITPLIAYAADSEPTPAEAGGGIAPRGAIPKRRIAARRDSPTI